VTSPRIKGWKLVEESVPEGPAGRRNTAGARRWLRQLHTADSEEGMSADNVGSEGEGKARRPPPFPTRQRWGAPVPRLRAAKAALPRPWGWQAQE
ncbi:hypothetical protein THAOC_22345, partial [Thalassiosira oceanica]